MDISAQARAQEGPEDDEVSSLSDYDSEWTQVTEDDSDFQPFSAGSDRPLSRADTADDSVDGDVWEGLADADDGPQSDLEDALGGAEQETATHIAAHHLPSQSLSASVATHKSDDEIESDALNCSVAGTLAVSRTRSATSSLHASLSESQSKLRLSFPDPLTSRDNLDTIAAASDAELSPTNSTAEQYGVSVASESTSSFEPVESPSITAPAEADACIEPADHAQDDESGRHVLDILLYGSASAKRWEIASKVMQAALDADEAPERVNCADQSLHTYRLWASTCNSAGAIDTHCLEVRVLDRTTSSSGETSQSLESNAPSLAIVLLPSSFPSELPQHTYYLPLISSHSLDLSNHPSSFPTFSAQIVADSAQYAWNHLGIASEKTIRIGGKRSEAIYSASALDVVSKQDLVQAFRCVFEDRPVIKHRESDDCARVFANGWHVVLFVIATTLAVSIGSFRPSGPFKHSLHSLHSPDTHIPLRTPSPIDASTAASALVLTTSEVGVSGSRSGYQSLATFISRSMAQTNFSPLDGASRAVAKTTPLVANVPLAPEKAPTSEAGPSSLSSSRTKLWAKKLNLGLYNPTDMMVRPAAGVDVIPEKPKSLLPMRKQKSIMEKTVPKLSEDVKAVGLRAVHTSLSLISNAGKAIMEVAGRDVFALYEAIDELLRAIRRQIDSARAESNQPQTSVDPVSRNARAKQNARRLRQMGEKMFRAAGERLNIGRAEALKVAHQICDGTRAPSKEDAKRLKLMGETFLKAAGERLQTGTSEAVKVAHQLRDGTISIREEAAKSRETRRQRRQESKKDNAKGLSDASSADDKVNAGGKGKLGKREHSKTSHGGKKQRKRMLRGQSLGGNDEVRRDGGESRGVLEALMDVVH